MSSPLFLGLDVGTQGCKAVVYSSKDNKVVSRGSYIYDILKSDVPGRAEQHPSLWIEVGDRVQGPVSSTARTRAAAANLVHRAQGLRMLC